MSSNISFDIKEIDNKEYGSKYHVSIRVPMSWFLKIEGVFLDIS